MSPHAHPLRFAYPFAHGVGGFFSAGVFFDCSFCQEVDILSKLLCSSVRRTGARAWVAKESMALIFRNRRREAPPMRQAVAVKFGRNGDSGK